ncbi:hypothetical protein CPC08DRAFT_562267 [Agrocybe pediades]|nr:hypothetical protein CPC08DRAFT_562267 [Agrocybe pediades]
MRELFKEGRRRRRPRVSSVSRQEGENTQELEEGRKGCIKNRHSNHASRCPYKGTKREADHFHLVRRGRNFEDAVSQTGLANRYELVSEPCLFRL